MILDIYGPFHGRMLSLQSAQLNSQELVGLYRNILDILPKWEINVRYHKEFNDGPMHFSAELWAVSLSLPLARNTSFLWK